MTDQLPTQAQLDRLIEVKDEIKSLVQEALNIVRWTPEGERSRAYWYAHIVMSLDDDHMYLGNNTTIADTVDALRERIAEREEEEEEG